MNADDILSNGETREEICKRLIIMMEQSRLIVLETLALSKLSHVTKVGNRRSIAIKWIKEVAMLAESSNECRDTSVQLFDRFWGVSLPLNDNILDRSEIALAAAAAVLISSKVHEGRHLSVNNFPRINKQEFIAYEAQILKMLNYTVFPTLSPTCFIKYFLLLSDGFSNQLIIDTAHDLVGQFLAAPEAPLFAPSTIALATLLISYSRLNLNCDNCLKHIPSICLPIPNNPIMMIKELRSFMDVDNCLNVFYKIIKLNENIDSISSPKIPTENLSNLMCNSPDPTQATNYEEIKVISPECVFDVSSPSKAVPLLNETPKRNLMDELLSSAEILSTQGSQGNNCTSSYMRNRQRLKRQRIEYSTSDSCLLDVEVVEKNREQNKSTIRHLKRMKVYEQSMYEK